MQHLVVVVMVTVVAKHPVVKQLMVRVQSVKHPDKYLGWKKKIMSSQKYYCTRVKYVLSMGINLRHPPFSVSKK